MICRLQLPLTLISGAPTLEFATKLEFLFWIPLPLGNQAIGGISIRMYASRTEIVSVVLHQRLVSTVIRSHQSGLGNTHRTHTGIHRWPFYGLQRSN